MAQQYWFPNSKPIFPGPIGCGMRLTRSKRTTQDRYRSEGAAFRRAARKRYRKLFKNGGGPGFKSWFEESTQAAS